MPYINEEITYSPAMSDIIEFFTSPYILSFFAFLTAFISAIRMFPIIIHTVREKNIMDEPGGRKIHATKIPTLGGVGLFASFALSLILFGLFSKLDLILMSKLLSLLGATLILMFLGMKDDLIAISPKKKLVWQLFVTAIVVFITDVRIESFNGLLGIWELPYIFSVVFTFFVFILVINAFNLIDGIDGLAGAVALIGCCTFGLYYLQNERPLLSLIAFILIGAILGFLRYNLSKSLSKKLFMGDSGSMFIGFLLAYQGISYLTINNVQDIPFPVYNATMVLLSVLSFPLLDTLRVFTIRALEKRSPFSPDHNHIHHRLLELGLSHGQATFFIVTCNWILIGVVFLIWKLDINLQLLICLIIGCTLYLSPYTRVVAKALRSFSNHKLADGSVGAADKKNISESLDNNIAFNSEDLFNKSEEIDDNSSNYMEEETQIKRLLEKRNELIQKSTMKKID